MCQNGTSSGALRPLPGARRGEAGPVEAGRQVAVGGENRQERGQ
jgi:hypothetical protein